MKELLYEELLTDVANLREEDLFIAVGKIKELKKKNGTKSTPYNIYRNNLEMLRSINDNLISNRASFYDKERN
ncbi:hypothetical protein [Bacillus atrophaeus]|uniref:hypothetical protein n=1 Tax=Bacillus atrophaeus TaxID=1452 RepID=UPI002E2006CA|nr:hypothetical protein [Bacillus atrophaeus]MED1032540.1 hypothetical protein [Bacillus atrophaeus]MED1121057.1 hypothetical protein [Bacillus atrophaeus]